MIPDGNGRVKFGHRPILVEANMGASALGQLLTLRGVTSVLDSEAPVLQILDKPSEHLYEGDTIFVRYLAIDNVANPGLDNTEMKNPVSLEYQYRLIGWTEWSQWSAKTVAEIEGVDQGDYVFEVRAKDINENISVVRSLPTTVEE